jgi:Ion channel
MSSPLDAWERRTAPILTALAAAALVTLVLEAAFDAHTRAATVGYGDRYPVTPEGRVVGGVLMVVGIATMGAVTAAIASQLINPRQAAQPQPADERVHQLEAQIAHLTAQLDSARGNLTPVTDKSRSHAGMTNPRTFVMQQAPTHM